MVRKTTLKALFSFLITGLCVVSFGFGQSIFENPITGEDIDPEISNPYTNGQNVDPNITVSGIGKGTGAVSSEGGFGTNNRYNLRGWDTETLDPTAYFEFTMEPNSGYKIDFISFEFACQRSGTGPTILEIRSSLDDYSLPIGGQTLTTSEIEIAHTFDLIDPEFQNVATSITFRVYAWDASSALGTLSINDFTFNGVVSPLPCASIVTWNGTWSSTPDSTTEVIIDGNYDTATYGSFSACKLTISTGSKLTVANGTFVKAINDVVVDGELLVGTQGNFVQSSNYGIFILTPEGDARVIKQTAPMNAWYEYTYWSSPVSGLQIGTLTDTHPSRRFIFNAKNFLDATKETENNNTLIDGQDDIDDDGNDWQKISGTTVMAAGVGYAATVTESGYAIAPGTSNKQFEFIFEGLFNNGEITVPVYRNDFELNDKNWNLIGNPYPSAMDADLFLNANSSLDGAIFLWSQNTPPSSTANGNEALNFSGSDYAIINGTGEVAGGDGVKPERKIPSGQGFFVCYSDTSTPLSTVGDISEGFVIFNNSMRMIGANDNSQFFKNSSSKSNSSSLANKLWINLTSNNGVFNQTLVGYVAGATNNDDGMYYDAEKNISTSTAAIIYTTIEDPNKKYAIQGKGINSLNAIESIQLGFATTINLETLYTLSIAQLQGEFLTNNPVYLNDNLLNTVHNLSDSDYTFTSEVGEFNDRFVVIFNNQSLSTDELLVDNNTLKIIDLNNDQVQFIASNNLTIKKVVVFDLFGRELYQFKGQNNSEIYNLPHIKHTIYIAKVELSNGAIITKKVIKK